MIAYISNLSCIYSLLAWLAGLGRKLEREKVINELHANVSHCTDK